MAVDKQRRSLRTRLQPISINNGKRRGWQQLSMVKANFGQLIGQPLSGVGHIRFIFGQSADTRQPQQFLQAIEGGSSMILGINKRLITHFRNPFAGQMREIITQHPTESKTLSRIRVA